MSRFGVVVAAIIVTAVAIIVVSGGLVAGFAAIRLWTGG